MNILDDESIKSIQAVIDTPPTCAEALNMAMGLHLRTSIEFKLKALFASSDSEDVKETQAFLEKFWEVLAVALEADLPFAAEQHGLVQELASDDEGEDEEECGCPNCRFRVGLVQTLIAQRNANPEAGGEIVEDVYTGRYVLANRLRPDGGMSRSPNYGNNPFQPRPRTFMVPGNNTRH